MVVNGSKKNAEKSNENYICESCDFICSKKSNFELFSKTESLSDQFILKKSSKVIFKPKNDKKDFRFYPVFTNLKNFQKSINGKKLLKPNFFDAKKVHSIINELSSI